jgi:RNA polymerase sigma factor (sigma-70 family)
VHLSFAPMSEASRSVACTPPRSGGDERFSATHWSVVLKAGQTGAPGAAAALEKLCGAYWYPVYAWIRARGHGAEEARDLTQEFFASLLHRDSLATVSREKGRFRTFLIRSIQYFLTDHHRQRTSARRGGGAVPLELDSLDPETRYALEPATNDSPDAAFDRRWCQVLVARAFQRMEAEQQTAGRGEMISVLRHCIGGAPDSGEYARAAQALGMSSNAIAVTVRRLRLRCREIILEEVMETVETREEAESEVRALFGGG